MDHAIILTLIGADRPGLVHAVAARATAAGANWVDSRMTCLAGRFAGVVHLTVPAEQADALATALRDLSAEGLQVTLEYGLEMAPAARQRVRMDLIGHDHPGIVERITTVLARHGVSIEDLETGCEPAPMSGLPLFRASVELGVPETTDLESLTSDLEAIAGELMVDLTWEPV